ncbi:type I-C CRISPR-associated protein Cas7/Csd2 [Enterococcus saccharolyticus]|uniref:type I-C CRISPR-associated protein Cas7/Csd2 n=1 Tax=Enterococcus TaxID=1350 RepID=UPI001E47A00B|nr:type I-C CRISPR-associated protein Cas7/Csd2 [Enterococcus saccharolyticus]MCD5001102.1 type I-C CRISPR-associated protein Cas7/Csd2 [Enterococcus saccharolyticus]
MNSLDHKIDFAALISVEKANPNGDPLNGNRPRQNFDGYGEISDVAIKRKIRNRLIDMGEKVFVQSNDKKVDGFKSLKDRADAVDELKELSKGKSKDPDKFAEIAAKEWIDVRSFGQVFAFKGQDISVGVRGPVSIHTATSIDPIDINSMQITKSVNSVTGDKKGSDTMGMKHRVNFGLYLVKGSINVQLAEKTNFTEEDANKIKEALQTLFENDASSARPDGSMAVEKLYWWTHSSKLGQYPSAKVHRSLHVHSKVDNPNSVEDYEIKLEMLDGLKVEELIDGL